MREMVRKPNVRHQTCERACHKFVRPIRDKWWHAWRRVTRAWYSVWDPLIEAIKREP